jgi:hypothetical protein
MGRQTGSVQIVGVAKCRYVDWQAAPLTNDFTNPISDGNHDIPPETL